MPEYIIAPSILSADFAHLGDECAAVLAAGADWIHFDVMDNHYVPNLTFGPMIASSLRNYGITAPIDVHLMVSPVDALITEFSRAGASVITFHPEASNHVDRSLRLIKDSGAQCGLALNPATPLSCLDHVMDIVDMVLIMSVNPGFGGQKFIPSALEKISTVRRRIEASGREIRLEVDGGVCADNIGSIATAGADTFVAGSAVFGAKPYTESVGRLRASLQQA